MKNKKIFVTSALLASFLFIFAVVFVWLVNAINYSSGTGKTTGMSIAPTIWYEMFFVLEQYSRLINQILLIIIFFGFVVWIYKKLYFKKMEFEDSKKAFLKSSNRLFLYVKIAIISWLLLSISSLMYSALEEMHRQSYRLSGDWSISLLDIIGFPRGHEIIYVWDSVVPIMRILLFCSIPILILVILCLFFTDLYLNRIKPSEISSLLRRYINIFFSMAKIYGIVTLVFLVLMMF